VLPYSVLPTLPRCGSPRGGLPSSIRVPNYSTNKGCALVTVKDQLPSFPELITFYQAMCEVAHGTSDDRLWNYHSTAERDYAQELATAKVMNLIRDGSIRTTGRMSETKKGTAKRWEAQQYKQHSKMRSYIDAEFWRTAVVVKSYLGFNSARTDGREYTDILLVLDDCVEHLGNEAAHGRDSEADNKPASQQPEYSTPYIELMWQAIDHFKISGENQPIKDTLVEWFRSQEIAGQKISRATAEYLASFVRLPESRLGGNRPWKVRAQQPQHQ
jgi:hypothetical protein